MAIITASELATYAPELTLTGAELDSAIALTQALIESPLGANRPLGISKFTDTLDLSGAGRAYLSYVPIVQSATTPTVAKIRGGCHVAYGISAQGSHWRDLGLDHLLIDRLTGEAEVLDYGHLQSSLYAVAQPSHHGHRHRPTQRPQAATLQVEYWSGFDFANPSPVTAAEVLKIKQLFGQALTLSQGDAAKGIKSRRVDREYTVEYQSAFFLSRVDGVSGIKTGVVQLDNLLKSFHIYRPRAYAL